MEREHARLVTELAKFILRENLTKRLMMRLIAMSNDSPRCPLCGRSNPKIDLGSGYKCRNEDCEIIRYQPKNRDEPRVESGHEPAQNVEMPVAYTLWECSCCGIVRETEAEITSHLGEEENYDERPIEIPLTEVSDAEDAVRQREQKVRREILGEVAHMLDEKIIKRNTIGNEDLKNDEQASAFFDELTIEIELLRDLESSLSEDLESSEYGDSTQGLRDDLQQEQEEEVDAS
jgi:hypothetical protein